MSAAASVRAVLAPIIALGEVVDNETSHRFESDLAALAAYLPCRLVINLGYRPPIFDETDAIAAHRDVCSLS